jgi:uncharacterized protein with von Willebrand factor type A (vWA) domain
MSRLGGILHAYQAYDPKTFPSPRQPAPDVAGAAFEHMMRFGSMRYFTDEDLANAIRIDPSQIAGLGPSLDALIAMLEERKRKILETYETSAAIADAARAAEQAAANTRVPPEFLKRFQEAIRQRQIRDLERLWYAAEGADRAFAADLLNLRDVLGNQYQVEALDDAYDFTGRREMDVARALDVKEELEAIDRLLEQLREAMQDAKLAVIDMDELARFVDQADVDQLERLREQVADYMRELAEQQGLERTREGYQLTPRAYKLYQSRLLDEIFSDLEAARSGRHSGPITGEGAVELPRTRPYEFGDSAANMDVTQSFINAMVREGTEGRGHEGTEARRHEGTKGRDRAASTYLRPTDIEIHETRNTPKCATAVAMDMSGSMRYEGQYVATKRMALAFDALIRSEYPGDYLEFLEMGTFAKRVHASRVPELMPKPVTIHDPVVRLKADMTDERITESHIPPHFTNIQHALKLARQLLGAQDTPNRQIILLTDGLPTAHFEGSDLYLLYPADVLTERATMREAHACAREGITINIFLLPNWSQDEDDIAFAHRMAEATKGRVFFTAGGDVDRFVLWDYVSMRRKIIG